MRLFSLLFFSLVLLLAKPLNGQYRVIKDDPSKLIKGHVAIEYFSLDVGLQNARGAYVYSVGANTFLPLKSGLALEGSLRLPVFRLESGGFAMMAEAGGHFTFMSTVKRKKEVTIPLSFTEYRGVYSTTQVTKSLIVEGNVKREFFARFGGYYRNSVLEYENLSGFSEIGTIAHSGGYLGVGTYFGKFFQVENNRANSRFAAGQIFKVYADVLILPTSVDAAIVDDSAVLGWRIGMKWYNSPFKREDNFGSKKTLFGNMFAIVELGSRPVEGTTITGSIGYIIKKF